MREILFRGKPKYDGEYYFFSQIWKDNCKDGFVCGSLVVDADRYYICVSAMRNINTRINNGMTSMIEVIPETVGQFTGLTDKNGKKIFEGDIVRVLGNQQVDDWKNVDYVALIAFLDGGFCAIDGTVGEHGFRRYALARMDFSLEIIGNQFDNPELLENP